MRVMWKADPVRRRPSFESLLCYSLLLAGAASMGCQGSSDDGSGYEPTSVIDPATGEPVATNYVAPSEPPVYVADMAVDKNLSDAFQDVWDGPVVTEAVVDLPRDYLIVGWGGRVSQAPNESFTTLVVHARRHNPDGTLGGIVEFRGGSVPSAGLEAWCEAPVGQVVAGVGGRIFGSNLTTIHIWTRPYNPLTRRLGDIEIDPRRCGSDPGAGAERRVVTWEHASNADEDRTVINGLVLRENKDNIDSLRARLRVIQ